MTIFVLTTPSQMSITPFATPITYANSRPSLRSTRSHGRLPCAMSSSMRRRRCGRPGRPALAPSNRIAFDTSSIATGRLFGRDCLSIAACPLSIPRRLGASEKSWPRRQSPHPFEDLQRRDPTLPRRLRRSVHQQSGRTGPAHGQGQNENLRLLPILRRRRRLPPPQIHRLHRSKTAPRHPPNPDPKARNTPPSHGRLNRPAWELPSG